MQFITDGPDLPIEVLRAHEEGRLVLFCGAGISIPAGLPSFKGLVESVYDRLGVKPSPEEEKELKATQPGYDRVLNLLESPGRFNPEQVRREVIKTLATPTDPFLDTHGAILKLSRTRTGRLRLVTTNFDLLFQAADPSLRCTTAPLLPVPKPHKWDQLVYLHGRLDEADPAGIHLVLTSADFGTAYLVERWASRFVGELFRHFAVLFVGYAVDDPPMRYLIDAIAAERRLDRNLGLAFALVGHRSGKEAKAAAEWAAKGITPILYKHSRRHARLHRTLKAWGRLWTGGLNSKLSLVSDLAHKAPGSLPAEALSQFIWAVSDESGAMASELGRLGSSASLAWLEVLERAGVLAQPPLAGSPNEVALVDDGRTTESIPSLGPVQRGLAVWLAEHTGNPDLARWVVKKGARLHPEFRDLIRRRLADPAAISSPLRKVWLALTGSVRLQAREDAYNRLGFHQRIGTEAWDAALRAELRSALSPCLDVRTSWTAPVGALEGEAEDEPAEGVGSILSFNCELEAGQALEMMLEQLSGRTDWSTILSDMALDLTDLLRAALDFHAALNGASEEHDPSYLQHPSIAPSEQNNHFHGWTRLIDLVRDSFQSLVDNDPELARTVVGLWQSIPYPLFRRLVLFAFRADGICDGSVLLSLIVSDPKNWLWSTATQAELFPTLPILWAALEDVDRERLLDLVLAGPPRGMFRADLGPGDWQKTCDHSIWERLERLRRAGALLTERASSRLADVEREHPAWQLTGAANEDFPVWMETRWGLPTDFSAEELLALSDDEFLRVLREHQSNREGLLDAWRHAAQTEPFRAIRLLMQLREERYWDLGVWSQGLGALREVGEGFELRSDILTLLECLEETLLPQDRIVRAAADAIRTMARDLPNSLRPRLLCLWDSLFDRALGVEARRSEERVTDAINHPAGVLAEALLHALRSLPLERGSGIEEAIRSRLERIGRAEGAAAALARVIVASRLPLLHDLDPGWTREIIIPCFDWRDRDEAQGAWQGFLWSPWLRPSLWLELKPHFVKAFDYSDKLGRSRQNLAALLASVCVEGEDALSRQEASDCLRKLGPEGRLSVAIWLHRKLKDAGAQAAILWRDSIGPWLASAWPQEPALRDAGTSERLSCMATLAAEGFAEAAATISELIGPVEHARGTFDAILVNQLGNQAPEPCLRLLSAMTPNDPPHWFGPLGVVLDQIEGAQPDLRNDPRFRRLRDIAVRRQLLTV